MGYPFGASVQPKKRITFDFETRSEVDLKKTGAFKYSQHNSTRVTCLAFKRLGNPKVHLLDFHAMGKNWKDLPEAFRETWEGWIEEGFEFSAQNAFFETVIYKNVLVARQGWPDIPFRQFRCTAAKAAACALPRSLDGAARALRLKTQKDFRGYAAMMATCKPTRRYMDWVRAVERVKANPKGVTKATLNKAKQPPPPKFLAIDESPEIWDTLYTYCKIDVLAEEELDNTLPDLIPLEQEIWFLNQRLNWQGLAIDVPTIKKIVRLMEAETKKKLTELDSLTMGLVKSPHARQSVLDFLATEDVILPNLQAKTVQDFLKAGALSPDMARLLEIRQALSKTSTKKYQAFLDRVSPDGRVRDILLYHGATPTGRDTGVGVQPHNLPRGLIAVDPNRPYAAVENVANLEPKDLEMLYGESLGIVFSSILRNMITASKGHELFVADFSKIEVAVLWWLANNTKGLAILKAGKDPYIYQAAANLRKTYEEIEKALKAGEKWAADARQLGKAQILGAGFRMGWKKFKSAAFDQYRLSLTSRQSSEAIKNYREANEPVTKLWEAVEDAAVSAVENPGKIFKAGKCKFFVEKKFLWIELPSGRRMAYREPSIVWRTIQYTALESKRTKSGELLEVEVEKTSKPKKTVQFWGVDKSKKNLGIEFLHGGVITENIVQAVARDLMMSSVLRLEAKGYIPRLMVHDEGICERKKGQGNLKEFISTLCEMPVWGDSNLPLEAQGWVGPRYRK